MPTYVYECQTCSRTFEAEQRITEPPLSDCDCGSQGTLKRLIQPVAISFKGSGFYVTDSTAPAPAECTGEPGTCEACAPPSE